jgi:RNA-directed DNA polymerase
MSDNQLTPQTQPLTLVEAQPQLQAPPHPLWSTPMRIQSNQQLTELLEFKSTKLLTWLGRTKSQHYSMLTIRKRNGSSRQLHNPDSLMRVAQYKILTKILNKLNIPNYIFAFEKNKSIPVMAQLHVNKQVIISVDIKDFFHSIKQTQLHQHFLSLGIEDKPARTLSELCTYQAFVPQGALTSPKVANLVTAMTFGPVLKEYCDAQGLTLTIYADDVTISSTNPALNVSEVLSFVTSAIRGAGFRVNHEKTKVMWATMRQYVCGVVVNAKTNMIKRERYKLRAIVHNITNNGIEAEAVKSNVEPGHFASHVLGRLNWLKQLNAGLGDRYTTKLQDYLKSQREQAETVVTASTDPQILAAAPVEGAEAVVPW